MFPSEISWRDFSINEFDLSFIKETFVNNFVRLLDIIYKL